MSQNKNPDQQASVRERDRPYLQTLAQGLGGVDVKTLSVIMGPEELKATLAGLTMADFDDGKRLITLHTHTTASDGQLAPEDYLDNAVRYRHKYGYRDLLLAVTDHDTLAGLPIVLKKASQNPQKYQGIRLVLGCELSALYFDDKLLRPVDFELLHYGINPFDKAYQKWFSDLRHMRQQALPSIFAHFQQLYPNAGLSLDEFLTQNPMMKRGFGCYLAYITPRYICQKLNDSAQEKSVWDYFQRLGTPLADEPNMTFWRTAQEITTRVKEHGFGFLSVAHPYRIKLADKVQEDGPAFLERFFTNLQKMGVEGLEACYMNLYQPLAHSLDCMRAGNTPISETDRWTKIIWDFADSHRMIRTGGTDAHTGFLGGRKRELVAELTDLWQSVKPLIRRGYRILNKEVSMGMPAPCMPAISAYQNTGIGSAYGGGAKRIAEFFGDVANKIQLGPMGRTHAEAGYSPYISDLYPNPFFIPLEDLVAKGLLSAATLAEIYDMPKSDSDIDFNQVSCAYDKALREAYRTGKTHKSFDDFVLELSQQAQQKASATCIVDLQVRIPPDTPNLRSDLFLKGYTLGAPADSFSPKPQNWHFKIFDPKQLFDSKGNLGPAGKVWYELVDRILESAKGGLRIDHYIGLVNPFVLSETNPSDCGRLYSSPNHPVLGKYAKKKIDDFARITQKIILPCLKKHHLTARDIYAEDIGARPEQLDLVMKKCGLGCMLIAQFVDPTDWQHLYHLSKAKPRDIAVLDTHDAPSIQSFFQAMPPDKRAQFAWMLANDLRFNYTEDLCQVPQLVRMMWGALLASPAERVQAFFTSWTGQAGRYNIPEKTNQWRLRCVTDFEQLYFENLAKGMAYNPLDAIALAIYARGDQFYQKHKSFVRQLREAEEKILKIAREL